MSPEMTVHALVLKLLQLHDHWHAPVRVALSMSGVTFRMADIQVVEMGLGDSVVVLHTSAEES